MKPGIHPAYKTATITCACGTIFTAARMIPTTTAANTTSTMITLRLLFSSSRPNWQRGRKV